MTLQRMLEKQGLDVDTLESAQEALHYLVEKVPDVIFMDHMMPGMDGFQAVEAIKNNPATATIPIMMFTSKGGDLYLSQARALGAVGIMPKEVQPAELYRVLNNLGLVKDRRVKSAADRSSFVLLDTAPEIAVSAAREDIQEIARKAAESVTNNNELQSKVEELIEDHYGAIRKEIRDLRHRLEQFGEIDPAANSVYAARQTLARAGGLLIALVLVGLMLVPSVWLYRHYEETRRELANTKIEIDGLRTLQQQAKIASEERASLRAQLDKKVSRPGTNPTLLYKSIAWAIKQHLPSLGEQQSISFANFLATSPLVNGSGIGIDIISHQFTDPKLDYPSRDSDVTASVWNRIAALNNRVEVALVPAKP